MIDYMRGAAMYKALIVDDEKLIRLGMRRAIPWDSIGIGGVYVAKSGPEALAVIREHKPEIMITDIRMDEMTGLELIERAKKLVPDLRVLVLTGYDEFEYARSCIQLNVNDFFLKPIDEKALIEAVRKQVEDLEDSVEKVTDINESRARALTEQMNIEKTLRNLVHNRASGEQIEEFCSKYGYDCEQFVQAAILLPPLHMKNDKEDEYFATLTIRNICIGMVDAQNRGLTFIDDHGRIIIAFFLNKHNGSTMEWLHELNDIVRDEFDRPFKAAVGNPVEGLRQLNTSYSDAVHLLEYENEEYADIIQTKYARSRDNLFREVLAEMKNAMCENIGDHRRVLSIFERFCQASDSYNLSDCAIRRCCYDLASSVFYSFLCSSGKEADDRLGIFINSLMNTRVEEQLELTRLFLIKLLDNRENQQVHEIVDKAKQYINAHLPDDLSVTEVAAHLYVTPNYLSRLFKRVTGEGCYEYVVRKRLKKAKLLLESTNLKPFKIAEMVGYNDTNYFSLAIKKNTGMSPQKYRKESQKNVSAS